MVFEGNTVTTYAPDGTKVRGGGLVMNDFVDGALVAVLPVGAW